MLLRAHESVMMVEVTLTELYYLWHLLLDDDSADHLPSRFVYLVPLNLL
jgi:hypothetical protein